MPNPPLNHAKLARNSPFPIERSVWNCQKEVSWAINFTVTSWRARIKTPKSKRIKAIIGRSPVGDWTIAKICRFILLPNHAFCSLALDIGATRGWAQACSPRTQPSADQRVPIVFGSVSRLTNIWGEFAKLPPMQPVTKWC